MMCTTVLYGGVCHRTSTPHRSGNKMKEKKKKTTALGLSGYGSLDIVDLYTSLASIWLSDGSASGSCDNSIIIVRHASQ